MLVDADRPFLRQRRNLAQGLLPQTRRRSNLALR